MKNSQKSGCSCFVTKSHKTTRETSNSWISVFKILLSILLLPYKTIFFLIQAPFNKTGNFVATITEPSYFCINSEMQA